MLARFGVCSLWPEGFITLCPASRGLGLTVTAFRDSPWFLLLFPAQGFLAEPCASARKALRASFCFKGKSVVKLAHVYHSVCFFSFPQKIFTFGEKTTKPKHSPNIIPKAGWRNTSPRAGYPLKLHSELPVQKYQRAVTLPGPRKRDVK